MLENRLNGRLALYLFPALLGAAITGAAITGLALASPSGMRDAARPERPLNVLFILSDQVNPRATGWGGNGFGGVVGSLTPNLDRLAEQSVRFDAAFCSSPQCSPSRLSILTGRWPHNTGLRFHGVWEPSNEVAFPMLARDAGYETGHFGKHGSFWLDQPEPRSFDLGFTVVDDFQDYSAFCWANDMPNYRADGNYYSMPNMRSQLVKTGYTFNTNEFHPSGYFADRVIDFLEARAGEEGDGKPFVCWYSMICPHNPLLPTGTADPEDWAHKFQPFENLDLPPNLRKTGATQRLRDVQAQYADLSEIEWKEILSYYYGLLNQVDYNIGRVLTRLDELGLAQDTLVVYTADHGEMCAEMGCWSKATGSYDAINKVPLLMRLPGVLPEGRVIDELTVNIDLAPTLLEMTGVPVPDDILARMDGRSLVELMQRPDPPADWRQEVFTEFGPFAPIRHRMVRTKIDKYSFDEMNSGEEEYYDLVADPFENHNLIDDPSRRVQARIADLRGRLAVWWNDEIGHRPIYDFTTGGVPANPPVGARALLPLAAAVEVPRDIDLTWLPCTSAEAQRLFFGSDPNPPHFRDLVAMEDRCNVGTLDPLTTYYWRVEGRNANGRAKGDVWSFTTGSSGPDAPPMVHSPTPAHRSEGAALDGILTWAPVPGVSALDVHFGVAGSLALAAASLPASTTNYDPGLLEAGVTYEWRIDTRNAAGTTEGDVWILSTDPSGLAERATHPTPGHLGDDAYLFGGGLAWLPGSGSTSHDVYFGETMPPPFVERVDRPRFRPARLVPGRTYYWRVDEANAFGTRRGWTWRFTYRPEIPEVALAR